MARKRKKTSRKLPKSAKYECVPSRWGPGGSSGRGYRCRAARGKKGGQWVRQSNCKSCPRSYKRGAGAPKRRYS